MTYGTWYPVITLEDRLCRRDESPCGRPAKSGVPCKSRRLSSVVLTINGMTERYEAPACRSHATEAELAEHVCVSALAEGARREAIENEPVACWSWPVADSHRERATEADACPDAEKAYVLACRLLADWQAGRCAICGGRAEVDDHDHATGLVRGKLCQSCNTREGFAGSPGDCFDRYRLRNPASILGLAIRYYDPITGWAEPAPPPLPLDGHAAYVLATRYGTGTHDD